MIKIKIPEFCISEQKYILDVLLGDFLGLRFEVVFYDGLVIELCCDGSDRKLTLNADFFIKSHRAWLKPESMPVFPLKTWRLSGDELGVQLLEENIPVLYGQPGLLKNDNHWHLNIDLFGSAFFMLSRYEELITSIKDRHDRFPAYASVAYKSDFLDRPIVNEYLEILWSCANSLWPDLKRKPRKFKKLVSCDVDYPYQCGIKNPMKLLKHIGSDLLIRKSLIRAIKTTMNYFASKTGNYSFDPYYTKFDWMMDVNEKMGNKISFFFIAGSSSQSKDGCYSLDEPVIRKLMCRINKRGHEIGLHPSYNTFKNRDQLFREADNLRRVMKEEAIEQEYLGSRQHYLRWETPTTAQNCEAAGLDYDSTLYFADHVGFRCGVCFEYSLYNLHERKTLNLVERPLLVMEGTLLNSAYNSVIEKEKVLEIFSGLALKTRYFNGDLAILWHNSSFDKKWHSECYENIVKM